MFLAGRDFQRFFFTETGDTNATPRRAAARRVRGAAGAAPARPVGSARAPAPGLQGDVAHTGFDNIASSRDQAAVVEDAGDGLHTQRNALDSAYLLDVTGDQPTPVRFIAEGRDPSATFDAEHAGHGNEGDNEITGIHVSDGDPTVAGLLGVKVPTLFSGGWRLFWTQQHGDNNTYEVAPAS